MEYLIAAGVLLGSFFVLWLVSVRISDASIVDPFWGTGFALVAASTWLVSDGWRPRVTLVTAMVVVWGLRLSIYLAVRNLGKGEDFRYKAMRRAAGDRFWIVSLFQVFGLQAVLAWIVSLPVQGNAAYDGPDSFGVTTWIGVAVWATGVFFEAVGDWQLARFKSNPANSGKVMDSGLWRYTRHPNYFGDFCVWWGIWIVCAPVAPWTIIGPAVMSFLLLRVSGVTMLEKSLKKRREGYEEYVARTNAFFPGPPKRAS